MKRKGRGASQLPPFLCPFLIEVINVILGKGVRLDKRRKICYNKYKKFKRLPTYKKNKMYRKDEYLCRLCQQKQKRLITLI